MAALAVLFGLVLLALAADRFVDGAAALARNFGISTLIVGLVIVGFGTSAPELLVSAMASLQGDPGISIGNALGSNISNIALVGGATAVLRPLAVSSGIVRREFRVLGVATLLLWVLFLDGQVSRIDGVILIVALALARWGLVRLTPGASAVDPVVEDTAHEPGEIMGTPRALAYA
ncbi:MAG: calcium/sodium antiporter, partial [Planctomycetota bacterium]